jgi:hypothetical protein
MDIRDAMMALQGHMPGMAPAMQGIMGNPAMAQFMGMQQPSPLGALQPGMSPGIVPPMMGGGAPPDFNAILQQRMVDMNAQRQAQQAERMGMMADRFGQRTGGAMQFDPSMGMQGMRSQMQDWRQAQRPMGFGGGGMQPQPMQPPTQPANVATLPGGGVQSGLGADYMKRPRMGGGGTPNDATNMY